MPDQSSQPKLCPNCGYILRPENGQSPAPGLGELAIEVLYWLVLALILGLLWSTHTTGDLQLLLGLGAIAVWFYLRARRRAAAGRGREQAQPARRHWCPNCLRRFEGDDLRER